jgi:hypothetical protein
MCTHIEHVANSMDIWKSASGNTADVWRSVGRFKASSSNRQIGINLSPETKRKKKQICLLDPSTF